MKKYVFLTVIFFQFILPNGYSQSYINGDFEEKGKPSLKNWTLAYSRAQSLSYPAKIDSVFKTKGSYSLRIENAATDYDFGVADYVIKEKLKGTKITLKGFVKTSDVSKGYAGLWLRIDSSGKVLQFDNMYSRGVTGSKEWTEYTIELPLSYKGITAVHFGGILAGNGRAWFDDLRLFVDDKPVTSIAAAERILLKADKDTLRNAVSGIDGLKLDSFVINRIAWYGQIWGFVKYHHPEVAKGKFNMDKEFIAVLEKIIRYRTDKEFWAGIENWIDSLGIPDEHKSLIQSPTDKVKINANYGVLFTAALPNSFNEKLERIRMNADFKEHYYVSISNTGNPVFKNEKNYTTAFPDMGLRLLALCRYWNMIQYYYPYRNKITVNWPSCLAAYIRYMVNADSQIAYTSTFLRLIALINDTHANIWYENSSLEQFKGLYRAPFSAKFIQGKLVITEIVNGKGSGKSDVQSGDIILKINNSQVADLVEKYRPFTPASNEDVKLRDLPSQYLLRSEVPAFNLLVLRRDKMIRIKSTGIPVTNRRSLPIPRKDSAKGFYLTTDSIGYLHCEKFSNKEMPFIKETLSKSKGLIVDMRGYPSEPMLLLLGNYLKEDYSPFAQISITTINQPGNFYVTRSISNGTKQTDKNKDDVYQHKIIILVNEQTQSQAEFTVMAFQSARNVEVWGSQTAGADGNTSLIELPGGITTMISGIGVFYPDGSDTQGVGVRIDVPFTPTLEGVTQQKDELLMRAIKHFQKAK